MSVNPGEDVTSALGQLDMQRRDQVKQQIQSIQTPGIIRLIESSEVAINIDPEVLPYEDEDMDYEKFVNGMKERYGLHLDASEVETIIARTPGASLSSFRELAQGEQAKLAFRMTDRIRFIDGKFPGIGRDEYTPIRFMSFHSQNLGAQVHGRTNIADLLIKEAFELAWGATSTPRKWESEEVQREIALKSYGTHTKVDLGANIFGLIAPPLQEFLRRNLSEGLALGARMIGRSELDNFEPPSNVAGNVFLDDIILQYSIIDLATGRHESPKIKVRVMSKHELGTGVVDVISELPFEDHVKVVEGLASALSQTDS
ncbi:hypothetical protein HLK59_32630 [Streptomyces sp. S3(2020)]|uniref:hypothetical protein n=1 Tax=Streptomyces sp. S3(2020) TaxID=2732044 RepID=UPI001488383D|nr:hypothetical protein [Streptomyces sp. S3(2020)]NNN35028.1 hypothetical protein [Streptomyces sp. S3(2020)]